VIVIARYLTRLSSSGWDEVDPIRDLPGPHSIRVHQGKPELK
jgi:hypothetical protein